jgi:hypothetical protein
VKKEVQVNFLTYPQKEKLTIRPANILLYGWVREKHVCVDLIGVFSLVGLWVGNFTVRRVTLKVASSKMVKHEKVL